MFLSENALEPAQHIRISAWLEHAPFAFWLMQQLRPEVVVELGTHNGFSFLAFCQAAKLNRIPAKIFAVDNWEGDEHAGFYGQEIFDTLEEELRREYSGIGIMLRSTFNEARLNFADGSVDLLHIDGRHRYEDVLEDFETWKSVLSEKSVVLFHDTRVQSGDFGVWRLWSEIEKKHPSFEFYHGNGLGVLLTGQDVPESIKAICRATNSEKSIARSLYARLGSINSIEYQSSVSQSHISAAHKRLSEIGEQCRLVTEDRDRIVNLFEDTRRDLSGQIDGLHTEVQLAQAKVDALDSTLEVEIALRSAAQDEVASLQDEAQNLTLALEAAQSRIAELDQVVSTYLSSTSWRMTKPYRWLGHQMRRARHLTRVVPALAHERGGYVSSAHGVFRLIRREGLQGTVSAWRNANLMRNGMAETLVPDRNDYVLWLKTYADLDDNIRQTIKNEIDKWKAAPLISIIMPVYNPPLELLEEAIKSVKSQIYQNWELCIADDKSTAKGLQSLLSDYAANEPRIKIVYREENGHISEASNTAIDMASGEWIALLDQDDLLTEDALFYVAREIQKNSDVKLIYSDEDKIDGTRRFDPYFKSDWNPDLLRSQNMISHLGAYKLDRIRKIGGFRKGFEGSQDHDLALRFTEGLMPHQIVHIPRVLYNWRSHSGSTAQSGGNKSYAVVAGQKAVQEHIDRLGISGKVSILPINMYKIKYDLPLQKPLVTIIIPTRNGIELLRQCINSIIEKTSYENFEIIVIDNNSDDQEALQYLQKIGTDEKISVIRDEGPFNYSALNNNAVMLAKGDFIVLMNNDIEIISPDWLSEMMGHALQEGVGAVGARLWYPDDRLQHAGVILGVLGVAGHVHKFLPKGGHGYFARAELTQTLSVVTAACLLVRKSIYEEVGGLDAENLTVAFNDVDFCIRVREEGYRNVWTPYAEMYHHESATRGADDTPEKKDRFRSEVLYMLNRWKDVLTIDPAYNPNLTLEHEDFSLAWPPRNNADPTLAS